jgi:polar amino acid transport system permease protein
VLALTLVYGAYVAEVYRAGIESVHWSQTAAARSLGLSGSKTMRFVVLPQAIRRVDGFRRAQIYAGTYVNLTSFTALALCFVVITIPMTRVTDRLLKRDQQRSGSGGGERACLRRRSWSCAGSTSASATTRCFAAST